AKSSTAFTTADIGRWVHIAVTYDSTTGAMSSYRDGRADGNHTVARGCALDLGGTGSNIGSWGSGRYFDGKLDDVRVYARALSGEEVRALAAVR
ncbi:MAG: LamG domain-containing protein, partial [Planctomycetota bacterium]